MPDKIDEDDIAMVQRIFECIGMAIMESVAIGVKKANDVHPRKRDTGLLREGWRNVADKIIAFAEKTA